MTMKLLNRRRFRQANHGYTLVEMFISMSIFTFAMTAFMYAYMFGLKQDQLAQSKLGASDESRRSFEKVARDIRCANSHQVGNYNTSTKAFSPCINGTNMVGNAIQIFLLAANDGNPNNLNIMYYFDTNAGPRNYALYRIHTGDTTPTLIASHLQNSATFSAEDYTGTVVTTMLDKDVIHFTLDFCEYQYPLTLVGPDLYYDRYVMDFRATPHVPGGK